MLTTTCPHCQTTFRVTPEQLNAHQGEVRCGLCHHIFNAQVHLDPTPNTHSPHITTLAEPDAIATNPAPPVTTQEKPQPSTTTEPGLTTTSTFPEIAVGPPQKPLSAATIPPTLESAPGTPTENAPPPKAEAEAEAEPFVPRDEWLPVEALDEVESLPTKRERKHSGLWLIGTVLLALLLAGQAIYDYRVDLARDHHVFKPVLQQLCTFIGCTIPLPRQINRVSIEASELQSDPTRPQLFVLHATLKNRASYIMAYPSLELSLTDIQDKVVVRRIFNPTTYLPKTVRPATGMTPSANVAITLYLEKTPGLQAAGYRLTLFYPRELPPIRRRVIVTPP